MNSPEFWSEYLQLSVALLSDAVTVELLLYQCTSPLCSHLLSFQRKKQENSVLLRTHSISPKISMGTDEVIETKYDCKT